MQIIMGLEVLCSYVIDDGEEAMVPKFILWCEGILKAHKVNDWIKLKGGWVSSR